ncbi:MAG: sigma-70 family RNA polymerase sigma factor [Oscillospiraceae bacterium]|nr:sigma-70 family RNA polymerase sigma factor [Oscillospiraceae bacterium]MBQ7465134.1 sigma-70 family RNA polymerase sigma factor [Oscillospiraceae bacterium]
MTFDEKTAVHKAQKGDQAAFAWLVEAYQGPVYRLALRMGLSPADAEEAAQNAFLAAWRGLPSFRGEAKFSTWLYRLASNAAVDVLRREKKYENQSDIEDLQRPDAAPSPQEQVERQDTQQAVRAAMAALPAEFRQVLVLRYLQEMSYQEIAQALVLPEGTVKSRINRAKGQLKALLAESGNLFGPDAVQEAGKEER